MIIFAGVVFLLSLVGIVGLFGIKAWEERSGRVLAPELRDAADREALRLRILAQAAQKDASDLPQHVGFLARLILRHAMLGFARLAQEASRRAHGLADMASHKHNFERRQTRSEFLKKVSEYKRGPTPLEETENI